MSYPKLVPHWIADVEVVSKDSTTFEKRNPATDQVIAQVARGGAAEVAHALSSAAGASEEWGRTPVPKRGAISPDRSRPGLGVEFKVRDASRFAI